MTRSPYSTTAQRQGRVSIMAWSEPSTPYEMAHATLIGYTDTA